MREESSLEALDRDGKKILSCPRASCHYRQKLPGEITDFAQEEEASSTDIVTQPAVNKKKSRRRVVRKKIVRKKRYNIEGSP